MRTQNNGDILLTKRELDDIKDDIKDEVRFREKVLIQLKLLRSVPNRVIRLEVWVGVLWVITSGIIFVLVRLR